MGIELPGFVYQEMERLLFYRYVLFQKSDHLEESTLLYLTNYIATLIDTYQPFLKQVATGQSTLSETIEEAARKIKEFSN